jgi:hypothetical protein
MRISAITLNMLAINWLIGHDTPMTVDQIRNAIRDESIFDVLEQCLIENRMLSSQPVALNAAEREEIVDALQRLENAVLAEALGVHDPSKGFLFLNGLFVELIQSNVPEINLQ